MIRPLLLLLVIVFSLGGVSHGALTASSAAPLRLHAWVDYFPAWVHQEFTRETGIPIVQTFFTDNKALYHSLTNDGSIIQYDVVTPSSEMSQRLINEKILMPLDRKKLPNLDDIDPWFIAFEYDQGARYSAPLFWGVLGIVVDKRVVPGEISRHISRYRDLWIPELRGKILLPNDFRSLLSVALLTLGYSVNDNTPAHLEEAMQFLESLSPSVLLFDTVDQTENMFELSTGVGLVWGREVYASQDNEAVFDFIFPEEGSPVWVDTMAIPASAANADAAHAFINFVLRPDVLARLSEYTGYAVAGRKARKLLPKSLRENSAVYPPTEYWHRFEPELWLSASEKLTSRWNRLKSGM